MAPIVTLSCSAQQQISLHSSTEAVLRDAWLAKAGVLAPFQHYEQAHAMRDRPSDFEWCQAVLSVALVEP